MINLLGFLIATLISLSSFGAELVSGAAALQTMKAKFAEGTRSGINCFVTVKYGVDHDAVSVSMINMNNDGTVAGINSCSLEDRNTLILASEPIARANLATNEVFANGAYVFSTAPGCGVAPVAKLANDPSDQGGVMIVNFANTMSICRYK